MGLTRAIGVAVAATVLLSACEYANPVYADRAPGSNKSVIRDLSQPYERDTVFGSGGLDLFGGGNDNAQAQGGGGIGVNSFLWRASLDTISFMPLTSADPFGGVIITDWYTPPEAPTERFKVNVYILAKALRADGIEVSVFKQQRAPGDAVGAIEAWTDVPVEEQVSTDLEDTILTRARQLRMAALHSQ